MHIQQVSNTCFHKSMSHLSAFVSDSAFADFCLPVVSFRYLIASPIVAFPLLIVVIAFAIVRLLSILREEIIKVNDTSNIETSPIVLHNKKDWNLFQPLIYVPSKPHIEFHPFSSFSRLFIGLRPIS